MNMNQSYVLEEFLRRNYCLANGGEAVLVVYRPAKALDGEDFECKYEIQGLDNPMQRMACGVDEVQCVLLALEMAAAALIASPEYKARQLYWLDPDDPDLGLPLSKYGAEYGWQ
jgi:hypothetical protein